MIKKFHKEILHKNQTFSVIPLKLILCHCFKVEIFYDFQKSRASVFYPRFVNKHYKFICCEKSINIQISINHFTWTAMRARTERASECVLSERVLSAERACTEWVCILSERACTERACILSKRVLSERAHVYWASERAKKMRCGDACTFSGQLRV